jgi:hypothetical protein
MKACSVQLIIFVGLQFSPVENKLTLTFRQKMSHYTVLVIGDDVDAALEPFQQYESDEPDEYLEFVDREDELRREYETDGVDKKVVLATGEVRDFFDLRFFSHEQKRLVYPDDAKIVVTKPYREMYATLEAFVLDMEGSTSRDRTTGRFGRWANPNGKWDWCQLGGRWRGFFQLKSGTAGALGDPSPIADAKAENGNTADSCLVGAIDFERTALVAGRAAAQQWDEVHASNMPQVVFKSLGMLDVARDEFIRRAETTCLGAHVVLRGGTWYEEGGAAPWGAAQGGSWAEQVTALLRSLPPETRVSLVDCHR